jgi:hypothetical protein
MNYSDERKQQIIVEIQWLKNKLLTVKKERYRRDLERQIKEREYNLALGIFNNNNR